jgi:hypothetical protein
MNMRKLGAVAGIAVLVLVLGLWVCSDRSREKNASAVLPSASPGADAFNAGRQATITLADHEAGFAEIFTASTPASSRADALDTGWQATITLADHEAGIAEIFTASTPAPSRADALDTGRQGTTTPADHDAGLAEIFIHADERPEEVNHAFHWKEDADWVEYPQDLDEDPLEELGTVDAPADDDGQSTGRRRSTHFLGVAGIN